MAKELNGSDLMIFIKEGTAYKSLAFSTSSKLSISAETVETSSKDTGGKWVSKSPRKLSWNMSTDNLYAVTGEGAVFDDLYTAMTNRTEIEVVFSLEKDYATKADAVPTGGWIPVTTGQLKGKAIITSLELNAPNGDNATDTASFEGTGALTKA